MKEISEEYRKELLEVGNTPMGQSKAMHKLLLNLQNQSFAPNMFVPIEKFAVEQSSKTFGNSAFNAYKKFNLLTIQN